jgi:hypothetical protein
MPCRSDTFPGVRRLLLSIALLIIGLVVVGAGVASLVGTPLVPLAQMVGASSSAAGASTSASGLVLGLGLIAAAINPGASKGWVRAGILYGFALVGFELGGYLLQHTQLQVAPILVGLLCSLLLIALYPQRKAVAPTAPAAAPRPAPPAVTGGEPEAAGSSSEKQP